MSDIDKLARATKNSFDKVDEQFAKVDERFDKVDEQFAKVRHDMKAMEVRMDKKMDNMKDEIIHEFQALAENIHQDVAGVNKDEISLIKDNQKRLATRLTRVERRVGV